MTQTATAYSTQLEVKPLLGKAGIVTGAGTGIGRAIATRLAELGADVGINYYRSENGAKTTQEIVTNFGSRAILLQGDVSQEVSVESMVEKFHRELDGLIFL